MAIREGGRELELLVGGLGGIKVQGRGVDTLPNSLLVLPR